jgi:hypothetical protein
LRPAQIRSSQDAISTNSWKWLYAPAIPATAESINRRISVLFELDKKQDPIPKITRTTRARGIAQVV